MDLFSEVKNYYESTASALKAVDSQAVADIAEILIAAKQSGRTIFTAGNGGSAATASHMANDLMKGCRACGRVGFKVQCLSDSTPVVTCLANDFCYEDIYKIQLQTFASRSDILCVFTGSGNSENIVRAAEYASNAGITVIGFLGRDGGKTKALCDKYIIAPTDCMEQIEDIHMATEHALASVIRAQLEKTWGIEIIDAPHDGRKFKAALFDFDGTLSLIREGWQQDMIPYFCEELMKTAGGKELGKEEVERTVTDFVAELTGKQTIFQCMRLAKEIKKYGGIPQEPMEYKKEYLRRLMNRIDYRRKGLADGSIAAQEMLVRGVKEFVGALKDKGLDVYCASGTDQPQVLEEAKLLGLDGLFGSNIYGALDSHATDCTKELVISRILDENNISGEELLSFGDGFVEIELVSKNGGYSVAVATNEKERCGVDEFKRERLKAAGASAVIPDFENCHALMSFIFDNEER